MVYYRDNTRVHMFYFLINTELKSLIKTLDPDLQ